MSTHEATDKLIKETQTTFTSLPHDSFDVRRADVGDRVIYMQMTGDQDVLEVILTRKKSVVARALTASTGFVVGKKYDMPLEYSDRFPPMVNGGQALLYKAPKVEKAKKAGPVRAIEGGITKIQRCRELFAANSGLDKAAMIDLFVREANCTAQGAVTYYITCKKG